MTTAGRMTRRVTFQQQGLDDDGNRVGAWADVVTRAAEIKPKTGGEAVVAQRLEGHQPVLIYVWREALTKGVDNSYRVLDAREPTTIWNVASAVWNEAEGAMEILAVQHRGGSDV